jgi:hypothetical protein
MVAFQPPPTAVIREEDLVELARKFNKYLCEVPGTQLTASRRLGIAICARDALLRCEGCQKHLQDKICLHPHVRFQQFCGREIQHSPGFPSPSELVLSDEERQQDACLLNTVHALICHQSSLNDDWYDDTIQAMRDCNLLFKESKITQYHSALIEIILVATMSHGIHMAFLVQGKEPVSLPKFEDIQFAPAPYQLNMENILKPGRKLRKYDWISHAPFVLFRDINLKSPEFSKISPEARKMVPPAYSYSSWPMQPHVCASLVYEDAYMLAQIQNVLYTPNQEVVMSFRHLDPAKKCTLAVTRFELEVVAEALAASYDCAY